MLTVTYTPHYPEEKPEVELTSSLSVTSEMKDRVREIIEEELEENIGMPSISVVQMAIKEYLDEANEAERTRIVEERKRAKEEADRKELVCEYERG